jgi:hypothetical protein
LIKVAHYRRIVSAPRKLSEAGFRNEGMRDPGRAVRPAMGTGLSDAPTNFINSDRQELRNTLTYFRLCLIFANRITIFGWEI